MEAGREADEDLSQFYDLLNNEGRKRSVQLLFKKAIVKQWLFKAEIKSDNETNDSNVVLKVMADEDGNGWKQEQALTDWI